MTEIRLYKVSDIMDPRRCQAQGQNGNPCPYRADEGKKYCPKHAARGEMARRKDRVMRYKLGQEKERIAEQMKDDPTALSLRDEVIILRITLQEVLTKADAEPHGFILNAEMIANLTRQIGGLVEKCFKLEQYSEEHLSRTQVMELTTIIMNIVSEFVTPEQLKIITNRIGEAVLNSGRSEHEDEFQQVNSETVL